MRPRGCSAVLVGAIWHMGTASRRAGCARTPGPIGRGRVGFGAVLNPASARPAGASAQLPVPATYSGLVQRAIAHLEQAGEPLEIAALAARLLGGAAARIPAL